GRYCPQRGCIENVSAVIQNMHIDEHYPDLLSRLDAESFKVHRLRFAHPPIHQPGQLDSHLIGRPRLERGRGQGHKLCIGDYDSPVGRILEGLSGLHLHSYQDLAGSQLHQSASLSLANDIPLNRDLPVLIEFPAIDPLPLDKEIVYEILLDLGDDATHRDAPPLELSLLRSVYTF